MKIECSIIIPTYNCLEYLKQSIWSAQSQASSYNAFEIIIINDGSTDGTKEYLESHPELISIHSKGLGPSKARNRALDIAKGEFVAFLDADDLWWADKLKNQIAFMKQNINCVFSFSDYIHFDPEGQLYGTCFDFWKPHYRLPNGNYQLLENATAELLAMNCVGTSCVIARLDALKAVGGFPTGLASAEDWGLWLKLSEIGQVGFSSAVTMSYLMRPNSVTANRANRINAMEEIIEPFKISKESAIRKALLIADARLYIAKAEFAIERKAFWEAASNHLKALLVLKDIRTARAFIYDFKNALWG